MHPNFMKDRSDIVVQATCVTNRTDLDEIAAHRARARLTACPEGVSLVFSASSYVAQGAVKVPVIDAFEFCYIFHAYQSVTLPHRSL